jgi:signal transduction histidine kinase
MLEIADTGHGFASGTGPQAVRSGGRTGQGLGMGVVTEVVERHGGAVRIAPRTGGGTRVTVTLPACG